MEPAVAEVVAALQVAAVSGRVAAKGLAEAAQVVGPAAGTALGRAAAAVPPIFFTSKLPNCLAGPALP